MHRSITAIAVLAALAGCGGTAAGSPDKPAAIGAQVDVDGITVTLTRHTPGAGAVDPADYQSFVQTQACHYDTLTWTVTNGRATQVPLSAPLARDALRFTAVDTAGNMRASIAIDTPGGLPNVVGPGKTVTGATTHAVPDGQTLDTATAVIGLPSGDGPRATWGL